MARRAACYVLAGSVTGDEERHPLTRAGYTAAREHVYKIRNGGSAGFATLVCPGKGSIPLYQCYPKQACEIEGSSGTEVLAGARRKKRR